MNWIEKLDKKYEENTILQFVKFNLTGMLVAGVQLILANVLPFVFDGLTVKLPEALRGVFDAKTLFNGPNKYVVDGVVTWGYVLPFFLSNLIANIFGYFLNMRSVFRGKGRKWSIPAYCVILFSLILFTTWLQGAIVSALMKTDLKALARTIAMYAAGFVQLIVLFPLEKYILFK